MSNGQEVERNFLEEIVPGSNDGHPRVDIVAIHGLNPLNAPNPARSTWTAKNGTMWLCNELFLPKEIPGARVLLFSYNSNIAIHVGKTGIPQQATNLLNSLEYKRTETPNRPLILLCHSLGGLVVKEALRTASLGPDRHRRILHDVCGVVFFGTPHRGSGKLPLGKALAKLVRVVRNEIENSFLKSLDNESLYLKTLHDHFISVVAENKIPIVSVVETRPLAGDLVVDRESATLGISPDAEVILERDVDHRELCRYEDSSNSIYGQVIHNIRRFIRPIQPENAIILTNGSPQSLAAANFIKFDIATMYGSGRTITWMTTHARDMGLLQSLEVAYEELVNRKGIIETASLQKRWSKLRVLNQGQSRNIQKTPPKDDVGKFTWLMTLIYAVLKCSCEESVSKKFMIDFFVSLFDEVLEEIVRGQARQHLDGWGSLASVKLIENAAKKQWSQLERSRQHPPGFIPANDENDVLDFLTWLLKESSRTFITSSSDVYCLALMLRELGVTLLQAIKIDDQQPVPEFDESNWVVTLDKRVMTMAPAQNSANVRRGMRVPLDSMEESVMPWPQPEPDQTVRNAFLKGKDVGEGLEFSLMCDVDTLSREPSNRRLFYKVTTTHKIRQTRIGNSVISWIAKFYFPLTTEKLAEALEILLQDWRLPGPFHNSEDNKALLENKPIFGLLQSFILGYYYGALGKLIDTSQLLLREAYGSWGWWDLEVLQVMRSIWDKPPPQDQTQSDFKYCWRVNLLRAMAYLFAGAEISLINRLNDHAVGVVAKLSLVSGSILGQSVDKITAARFHLLDVDTSCIPNNANLILSGEQPYSQRRSASTNLESLDNMELAEAREDFTAHIEPDWQHDANSCLVAYRDEGRMVQRFSPLNIDIAMVASQADNPEVRFHKDGLSKVFRIPTSNFRGGIVMMHPQDSEGLHASQPTDGNEPLMAPTLARPRARACIAAMILDSLGWATYRRTTSLTLDERLQRSIVLHDEQGKTIILT